MKKILWLIAARSGSKSIADKNIKLLGGFPLISYRIKTALKTKYLNDVWVSTDSEEYAKISREFGANIPFIRPYILATDEANSTEVILHSMDFAKKNNLKYEYIGLLEPTSPFILSDLLDEAIKTLELNKDATAIVATRENRPNSIFVQENDIFLKVLSEKIRTYNKIGRQFFNKEITPSGGFYISKWEDFLKNKSFYTDSTLSFLVDDISGLEIDEPIDWQFAEFIIEKKLFNPEKIFN